MAERLWKRWLHGALRCHLEPVRRVARMLRQYWVGLINAATSDITNAMSESINSHIQRIKKRACGFEVGHASRGHLVSPRLPGSSTPHSVLNPLESLKRGILFAMRGKERRISRWIDEISEHYEHTEYRPEDAFGPRRRFKDVFHDQLRRYR
jgi:hypothetical protein